MVGGDKDKQASGGQDRHELYPEEKMGNRGLLLVTAANFRDEAFLQRGNRDESCPKEKATTFLLAEVDFARI